MTRRTEEQRERFRAQSREIGDLSRKATPEHRGPGAQHGLDELRTRIEAFNRLPRHGWATAKCMCGHKTCDRHTVEHPSLHGTFYQGCGWDRVTAQAICDVLNNAPAVPR